MWCIIHTALRYLRISESKTESEERARQERIRKLFDSFTFNPGEGITGGAEKIAFFHSVRNQSTPRILTEFKEQPLGEWINTLAKALLEFVSASPGERPRMNTLEEIKTKISPVFNSIDDFPDDHPASNRPKVEHKFYKQAKITPSATQSHHAIRPSLHSPLHSASALSLRAIQNEERDNRAQLRSNKNSMP